MGNSVRCSASNGTKSLSFNKINVKIFSPSRTMNNFNDNIIDEEFDKEESWADYMDRTDSEVYEKQVISDFDNPDK